MLDEFERTTSIVIILASVLLTFLTIVVIVSGALILIGEGDSNEMDGAYATIGVDSESTLLDKPSQPLEGENITIQAYDPEIEIDTRIWSSPDVELDETQGKEIQHAFENPGNYTVKYKIKVDGKVIDTQTEEISVIKQTPGYYKIVSGSMGVPTYERPPIEGNSIPFRLDIRNTGRRTESKNINLKINGKKVDSTKVKLQPESYKSTELTWNSSDGDAAKNIGYTLSTGDEQKKGTFNLSHDGLPPMELSETGEWSHVEPADAKGGYDYFYNSDKTYGDTEVEYTDQGFYIMKYEASKDDGMAVSDGSDPWDTISFSKAYSQCEALNKAIEDYHIHLITNREWNTVARQIAQKPENWADNTVGSTGKKGGLYQGVRSDIGRDHKRATALGIPEVKWNSPTVSKSKGGKEQRTHELPSGDIVWDMAGNVRNWVDVEETGSELTKERDSKFYETAPKSEEVKKGSGLGTKKRSYSEGKVVSRGGDTDDAGLFNSYAEKIYKYKNSYGEDEPVLYGYEGFRCAALPKK